MPHKKNPARGHNPFAVIGNAQKKGTPKKKTTTTKRKGPTSSGRARRRPGARSRVAKSRQTANRKRRKRR